MVIQDGGEALLDQLVAAQETRFYSLQRSTQLRCIVFDLALNFFQLNFGLFQTVVWSVSCKKNYSFLNRNLEMNSNLPVATSELPAVTFELPAAAFELPHASCFLANFTTRSPSSS